MQFSSVYLNSFKLEKIGISNVVNFIGAKFEQFARNLLLVIGI